MAKDDEKTDKSDSNSELKVTDDKKASEEKSDGKSPEEKNSEGAEPTAKGSKDDESKEGAKEGPLKFTESKSEDSTLDEPQEPQAKEPGDKKPAETRAVDKKVEKPSGESERVTPIGTPVVEVSPKPPEPKGGSSVKDTVMIEVNELSKFYGSFAAIRDVSFTIPAGQVVAFLGPNGAGKSTTMKILTGYLSPSGGKARIAGLDVTKERIEAARRIGYMPENGPLYLDMTPLGFLRFIGEARGYEGSELADRVGSVVRQCHLEEVLEKPISKLSKGYRQRVGMAQAFLHDPDVLILDEPTAGLDPNQIRDVRDNIREAGARKTILLSTHILQEVEAMADRVIFISEGQIAFDGTRDQLIEISDNLEECFAQLTRPGAANALSTGRAS